MTEIRERNIPTFADIRNVAASPTIAARARASLIITIEMMPTIAMAIGRTTGGATTGAGLIDAIMDTATVTKDINQGMNAALGTDISVRDTMRTGAKAIAALLVATPIARASISDDEVL